jgi:hypothetical protein
MMTFAPLMLGDARSAERCYRPGPCAHAALGPLSTDVLPEYLEDRRRERRRA